ncbi:hypothetical protein PpBr36_04223 [Pyricularia pennisetigena]|uniref:hypothetical protein n=1 Tax=Pyricularia pennisetigena TaxID=1578925 RepID=UPI0011526196|nr:hypothetical protein PpBr36_04223 [Pyricularia pennisetigena]TLS26602.1 hypothetical protein PpBr36_04223 [Pyricularia pennisetigena]
MAFSRTLIPAGRAVLTRATANMVPRQFAAQSLRRYASIGDSQPPRSPFDGDDKEKADLVNKLRSDPWVKEATGKIAQNPEAVKAIMEFEQILKAKGFDFRAGQQPSKLQMMKLMLDKDFRQAMLKLAEEMQKAGIDGNSPQMKEMMKRMGLGQ